MALVPYSGPGPLVPVPQSGPIISYTPTSEKGLLTTIYNWGKEIIDAYQAGKKRKRSTAGPLVVYQKPRYSTKRLPKYGRHYTGAMKLDMEAFEKFRGSGRIDPMLL